MSDDRIGAEASAPQPPGEVSRESALREILRAIIRSRDDEAPVFDAILKNASRLCHAPLAALGLISEDGRHYGIAAQLGARPEFLEFIKANPPELDPERYVAARAMVEMRTIQVEDLGDPKLYGAADRIRKQSVALEGVRTSFYVPLILKGRSIGALMLYRRVVQPFTEAEIALVETFAEQAVIAIENVRQFRELQTRLEREAATRRILSVISQSQGNENPVFDVILENAAHLCNAPFACLFLSNPERTNLSVAAYHGTRTEFVDLINSNPLPMDARQSLTVQAIEAKRPLQIADAREDAIYKSGQPHRVHAVDVEGVRTLLTVPLISRDEAFGVIFLYRRQVALFQDDEIALVQTFAQQAVIAIENVRQFRELQTRLEREAATRDVLEVISRSRDDDQPVFDVILENAARLCNAPHAFLALRNAEDTHLEFVAESFSHSSVTEELRARPYALDDQRLLTIQVLHDARVRHIPDLALHAASGNPTRQLKLAIETEGIRTLLYVPLLKDDRAIGLLGLFKREVAPFKDDEIALVETFAAQAVIAIENVRQFRELQTRLEREAASGEILQIISQTRNDEHPALGSILERACRLCEAPLGLVALVNEDTNVVSYVAHTGARPEFAALLKEFSLPMDDQRHGLVRAITGNEIVQIADARDSDLYRDGDPGRTLPVDLEGVRSFLVVPLARNGKAFGAIVLYRREIRPFTDDQVTLLQTFAAQAAIAIENVRQFRALEDRTEEVQALNSSLETRVEEQVAEIDRMGRLKRFLSPAVADAVVSAGPDGLLRSHRALIATLFCDIRGFTAFCESAEPEETIDVLQTYHEAMGALLHEYGAGVDQRSGDGIMAIFNDPLPCEHPAGDAVRMALAMRARMEELCARWKRLGHRLGFGVGISLGYATVGMVGSEGRYDYTASGTAVNVAARLCDEAEDGEILLSPRALAAVEGEFEIAPRGELTLKGIQSAVEVHKVIGPLAG